MIQFNPETDTHLNSLERQLAEAVKAKEVAESRYDLLFQQVFGEFDQAVGSGVPASFVCEDGFKLGRQVPQMQPVVDNKKAEEVIMAFGSGDVGDRMWKRVTDVIRTVNQDKLAAEIRKWPVLGEALDNAQAITVPVRKPSRIRREATKQERMRLEAGEQAEEEAAG